MNLAEGDLRILQSGEIKVWFNWVAMKRGWREVYGIPRVIRKSDPLGCTTYAIEIK